MGEHTQRAKNAWRRRLSDLKALLEPVATGERPRSDLQEPIGVRFQFLHAAAAARVERLAVAEQVHEDRLIAAAWADAHQSLPVTLNVVAIDRQGLVRDIGDLLASEKISIEMMHTTTDRTQSTATIDLRVAIDDARHLSNLLQRIRRVGSVLSVRRTG